LTSTGNSSPPPHPERAPPAATTAETDETVTMNSRRLSALASGVVSIFIKFYLKVDKFSESKFSNEVLQKNEFSEPIWSAVKTGSGRMP